MKKGNLFVTGIITAILMAGCGTNNSTAAENEALKQQVAQLEQQVTELEQKGTEVAGGNATAVVPESTQTTDTTGADTTTTNKSYTMEELTTMVDDFAAKAEAATPGTDESQNLEQFFALKQEENQIDNALDRHEDELEDQYRAGTLTREEYKQLERELEKLEDKLDEAEDRLERTFGIND